MLLNDECLVDLGAFNSQYEVLEFLKIQYTYIYIYIYHLSTRILNYFIIFI